MSKAKLDVVFNCKGAMVKEAENLAWGADGKTLLMTARTSVYTVRMEIAGAPSR